MRIIRKYENVFAKQKKNVFGGETKKIPCNRDRFLQMYILRGQKELWIRNNIKHFSKVRKEKERLSKEVFFFFSIKIFFD